MSHSSISQIYPAIVVNLSRLKDKDIRDTLRDFLRVIELLRNHLASGIAHVEILYVSQNDQPTPEEGEWKIWKDADATAGNPKAYLVTTQGGVTYTFKSDQVV